MYFSCRLEWLYSVSTRNNLDIQTLKQYTRTSRTEVFNINEINEQTKHV